MTKIKQMQYLSYNANKWLQQSLDLKIWSNMISAQWLWVYFFIYSPHCKVQCCMVMAVDLQGHSEASEVGGGGRGGGGGDDFT